MALGILGTLLSACSSPLHNSGEINGGKTEKKNSKLKEKIESTEIISFHFTQDGEYVLECNLQENGIPEVKAKGGGKYGRDGSQFDLAYETEPEFLEQLQQLTVELNLSMDNGHSVHVNGLPPCGGEEINISYESGERIFRRNNQAPLLKAEESQKIYEAFRLNAVDHGLDFNEEGSNHLLYNDADAEYVQGTWSGKHFGDDVKVVFEGRHVKIYINKKLTDDCEFKIVEGAILPDNDEKYPRFKGMELMRKSNEFTMAAYFYDNGSSTASLYKE